MKPKYTNALAHESSPYLLQHAHNPVKWLPWSKKSLQKAKDENKLMLVSVGYSSCHWCHVMERESFEDEEVAEIMNRHFICIKVDREERPDVDQVYMEAVQAMTKQGGWPLNCFTTPDAKPIYGGTYFPKHAWIDILNQLWELWQRDPNQVQEYGNQLANQMQIDGALPIANPQKTWNKTALKTAVQNWAQRFDKIHGGAKGVPKFALPSNYLFLLRYGTTTKNQEVLNQVELTLDKMLKGGIYDQVGGGFARYSTDIYWKVPHFEKMLYDNAQLLNLYAEAYAVYKKPDYLHISKKIQEWLYREMKDQSGSFYSAIDADSEGEEGKFYIFNRPELEENNLFDEYAKFYKTNEEGIWENNFIPIRKGLFQEYSQQLGLSANGVIDQFDRLNQQLLSIREKRTRPLTDDKSLCSWNAMLATGLLKTYQLENDKTALANAIEVLNFIDSEMWNSETKILSHSWKDGKAGQIGFLEDYAFTIQAHIELYKNTFDENSLHRALELTQVANEWFYDFTQGFYYTTAHHQDDLISRPAELSDNVIASANSVMAHSLNVLSSIFEISPFRQMADRLLNAVEKSMIEYPEGYGNWANLYLQKTLGSPEVVIVGARAKEVFKELNSSFLPNIIFAVSEKKSSLPIFANRFKPQHTFIYVCQNQTCDEPVEEIEIAKNQLKKLLERFEAV